MRFLFLVPIILLIACNASTHSPENEQIAEQEVFECPPCGRSCDNLPFKAAGNCPECGMELVTKASIALDKSKAGQELTICFYLQDNVELLDFAGPMEVFVVAGFKVFTVSKTKEKITSQGALSILPDYSIADAPPSDVLVLLGGAHSIPANDPDVISWIRSRKNSTTYFMSVCTGAFIMGKAGILDNLTATTYHTQIDALQKALPKTKVLREVRFVDNGNVISTAGISAGIDGALHLVAKIKGDDFAKKIAEDIEYDKWVPEQGLIIKNQADAVVK